MSQLGKWVTNDARDLNASRLQLINETRTSAKVQADYLRWRAQFIVGPPIATPTYTEEQLKAMGLIGLYWPLVKKGER